MKQKQLFLILGILLVTTALVPDLAFAGLEDSLVGIKLKLTGVILPLLSVIGSVAPNSACLEVGRVCSCLR